MCGIVVSIHQFVQEVIDTMELRLTFHLPKQVISIFHRNCLSFCLDICVQQSSRAGVKVKRALYLNDSPKVVHDARWLIRGEIVMQNTLRKDSK